MPDGTVQWGQLKGESMVLTALTDQQKRDYATILKQMAMAEKKLDDAWRLIHQPNLPDLKKDVIFELMKATTKVVFPDHYLIAGSYSGHAAEAFGQRTYMGGKMVEALSPERIAFHQIEEALHHHYKDPGHERIIHDPQHLMLLAAIEYFASEDITKERSEVFAAAGAWLGGLVEKAGSTVQRSSQGRVVEIGTLHYGPEDIIILSLDDRWIQLTGKEFDQGIPRDIQESYNFNEHSMPLNILVIPANALAGHESLNMALKGIPNLGYAGSKMHLNQVMDHNKEEIKSLARGLSDADPDLRAACVRRLQEVVIIFPYVLEIEIVEMLVAGLSDRNKHVRRASAEVLGSLRFNAIHGYSRALQIKILDALVGGLSDRDEHVRRVSTKALDSQRDFLRSFHLAIQVEMLEEERRFGNLSKRLIKEYKIFERLGGTALSRKTRKDVDDKRRKVLEECL